MERVNLDSDTEENEAGTQSLCNWTKGVANPDTDFRLNIWSLNGFGEPVFTGGMYLPDEARTLEETVKNYCASKNVTFSQLCGGHDHKIHDKTVRGAWQEIAQCLPHRTVLSIYRRALRQFHGLSRGTWSEEETSSLFRLVELHGHKWATIQDKLGRSATDCRVKYLRSNENFQRGKWSIENVELLLQKVRPALNVPRDDMDVREINQWTFEHNSKIPWTGISYQVNRSRMDCYFKWKQMTKRSNQKAIELGLEPIPMARDTWKFDVRKEYFQWKSEQDPKWRKKYADEFVLPLVQKEIDGNDQREDDIHLLNSIIESRAIRPSEVSWHTVRQSVCGCDPRERWEELVDKHACDDDMDLPLWKLARVVKGFLPNAYAKLDTTRRRKAINKTPDNHLDADQRKHGAKPQKSKKQKKKKKKKAK